MNNNDYKIRCILHGSFVKHYEAIQKTYDIFTKAGIEVIAPKKSEIISFNNGFALLENEENLDPRYIELIYLHHLKQLGKNGFSYFVNPDGYIGKSSSYELGIAQLSNIKCFFYDPIKDHPAYIQKNSIWKPEDLAAYILDKGHLPNLSIKRDEKTLHKLWEDLMVPGSVVAAGGIIELVNKRRSREKEILLVKTHKWGGRYSIVGGKVKRNERLDECLLREVKEETGLKGEIGRHICTFDQFKNSGYFKGGIEHIFVDNVVKVTSRKVLLNEEAQEYLWIPANIALKELEIEPNARHTLELYSKINSSYL